MGPGSRWCDLSSLTPPPRFSGGWPTGGFHGGFVASKCRSSRTAGPGFHLCAGTMKTFPCWSRREWLWVSLGRPVWPGRARLTRPRSESGPHREHFCGLFTSRWAPLSFGHCKWEILSLYFLQFFLPIDLGGSGRLTTQRTLYNCLPRRGTRDASWSGGECAGAATAEGWRLDWG